MGRQDNVGLNAKPVAAQGGDNLSGQADKFVSASVPGNTAYKIGPLDVLDVTVFKVADLSRSVQVADNGTINFPLIGAVPTAGKTAQDVERELAARLGSRYLQNPQVSVFVKEYNSQRVTVEGAVKKPGVYPLKGKSSLLQFIALAEGLDRETASSSVAVFRQGSSGRSAARFDIDLIRSGQAEDPAIMAGDVIVVDTSQSKTALGVVSKLLPVASIFKPF